jgi:hypothetical protein
VPFGVPTLAKSSKGFISPPKIGPGIGISSLNKIINNFLIVHAIFTQISSIGAACGKKLKNLNEITKNSFQGHFF